MLATIVAVSGGVDSMVMLDLLYHQPLDCGLKVELIPMHINHGTRPSADEDMKFVERVLSEKYKLGCFGEAWQLGEDVSEEVARKYRYESLRHLANNFASTQRLTFSEGQLGDPKIGFEVPRVRICTAHHLDDLVETVAINFVRGTGWRGLACLNAPDVRRPLLEAGDGLPMDKKAIFCYATKHGVTFREDPTNNSMDYLRNRIRFELQDPEKALTYEEKIELWRLWQWQKALKSEIDELVAGLIPLAREPWQRSWFKDLEPNVAIELLKAGVEGIGVSATRPQLENFRQAILTYAPGKYFNLPQNKLVKLNQTDFRLS